MKTLVTALVFSTLALAQGQRQLPTPAQAVRNNFADVNRRLLDMAQDFPEDKYNFKPKPEMRTFGDVIAHVIAGDEFGARVSKGENVKWDALEKSASDYKGKADLVASLKKWVDEANTTLKSMPDERFQTTLSPWMAIVEHAGEHYGQLVVYYRLNGMVPPESRPKSK